MKVNYAIIPECYADTNLVETITNLSNVNHQKSCNKVASTMQNTFSDSFALGIIDKDKRTIKYLDGFELLTNFEDLYLFKHHSKHHYIIQIYPAFERFILESAKEVDVDLKTFGLPNEFEQFKRVTKKLTSKANPNLRHLFLELKKRDASQIVTLSKWITYLKKNHYNSKIEEILEL